MKKKNTLLSLAAVCLMFIAGCTKENFEPVNTKTNSAPSTLSASREICGKQFFTDLVNDKNETVGLILVENDESTLYVEIFSYDDWLIEKSDLFAGDCGELFQLKQGNEIDPSLFPYHTPDNYNDNHYVWEIDLKKVPACMCISVHAKLVNGENTVIGWGNGILFEGENFGMYFNYCVQECDKCEGGLRTQTQGGWGAVPNGNNPGSFLHNNFAAAFPNGITVGCNKTIQLTSAQSVTDFLPQGSTPKKLTLNYVNPGSANITVLAGQVVALKISIGFDSHFPNFGANTTSLADMEIASGVFINWTVGELLAEAEKVLGNCASIYTPAQVNEAVSKVNENYTDGNVDKGFLACPKK